VQAKQRVSTSRRSRLAVSTVSCPTRSAICRWHDYSIGFRYLTIGIVYGLQGRQDEALAWFEKARGTIAAVPELWANLAAAHALRGDLADAAADLPKPAG
jgi:hypothetical protein